jgi:hypothetical protein
LLSGLLLRHRVELGEPAGWNVESVGDELVVRGGSGRRLLLAGRHEKVVSGHMLSVKKKSSGSTATPELVA